MSTLVATGGTDSLPARAPPLADKQPLPPDHALAAEALTLEHEVSDLVNAAYGLTPEEVALMWQTAPPRMPIQLP